MDRKKKNVDAVELVREIRDRHYEQTKNMTREQQTAFYQEKARKLNEGVNEERDSSSVK